MPETSVLQSPASFPPSWAAPRRLGTKRLSVWQRSGWIGWLGALGLSLGCGSDLPDRPNLVLVTLEAVDAEDLACFGGEPGAGASLCAFADGGTLFPWAAASHAGEAPAIATALTGLPASLHGVSDSGQSFLRSEHRTLAETLSAAGYRTAAFVASPRLNRSRRLDQGFDRYDDEVARPDRATTDLSINLSQRIQRWVEINPGPHFIWIHADQQAGLGSLDRLISRLSPILETDGARAGFLFAGLQGKAATPPSERIEWRSHRIPLLFRPPGPANEKTLTVSPALAGLRDIVPTLIAAARTTASEEPTPERTSALTSPFEGRDLNRLAQAQDGTAGHGDRFILLETPVPAGEVGLASGQHLYARGLSPLDGTGQPVPSQLLADHGARFARIPIPEITSAAPRAGRPLRPDPWREDILDPTSPVPRLEVHLARRLAAMRDKEIR